MKTMICTAQGILLTLDVNIKVEKF